MSQDQPSALLTALERAQATAYPAGEYVGQQSFMRAAEIRRLARQAGVGPGVPVLDLCCGVAGPGRMITAESGCRYLGVDQSASALATARQLAGELPCRFEQAQLPPLPEGRFEVVLLLETMLAFPDKEALVGEVARTLERGGRFAFTVEEGRPLTRPEQARMPAADTVWPVELATLTDAAAQRRAGRDLAAGAQLRAPRDGDRAASVLPGSFSADRRPDRGAGHRRADHGPSAVERLARQRAGAQVRDGGREAMTSSEKPR